MQLNRYWKNILANILARLCHVYGADEINPKAAKYHQEIFEFQN